MTGFRPLLLAVLAIVASCRGGGEIDPRGPRPVRELGRWAVTQDGERLGLLVLIEIEDPQGPVRLYRAENASGQWLGYVDEDGRVYQRVPFATREEFRGMYPRPEGLALLFEVDDPVEIEPLDGAAASEASLDRPETPRRRP